MNYKTLRWDLEDRVLTLTLNRPTLLNSFTVQMGDELIDAFRGADEDDDVRAVVVTGKGSAFCAGMDLRSTGNAFGFDEEQVPTLKDMRTRLDDPAFARGVRDTGGRVTLAIFDCKKPVIAAINGAAVGIGITMTLAMDVRLASDQARIGFVFGRLGITPDACSTWFLPRVVGISQALEWCYTADIFDAQEALRGGLIKSVVPHDRLLSESMILAHRFVDHHSPVATAMVRQMMYRNAAQLHPLEAHRIDSLAMFYQSLVDGKEGVRAFLEKRYPKFESLASDMPVFYTDWINGKYR